MTATATVPTALFPAELQTRREELKKLAKHLSDPVVWPEGERVLRAHGPKAIADILINAFHPQLKTRRLAYLWVERMSQGSDRIKLGVAAKASAKLHLLADVHFVLTFNLTAWQDLTMEQKVALVDHELQHCDVDGETNQPIMVALDIEEFSVIVSRYGLWKSYLKQFGNAVRKALQGDLF